jgi:hypothetical protein
MVNEVQTPTPIRHRPGIASPAKRPERDMALAEWAVDIAASMDAGTLESIMVNKIYIIQVLKRINYFLTKDTQNT